MQIQFAVLFAVLSASAASAADFAFYVGPDCHGQRLEQLEVGMSHFERKKMIPRGAKSFTISRNRIKTFVRVFDSIKCGKPDDRGCQLAPKCHSCHRGLLQSGIQHRVLCRLLQMKDSEEGAVKRR
ncbi:hypothetical protein BD779DRAFT_1471212 [Infundibulicybe gibba]|nr:hypothetical protein BD779DRAFT_1471212 [Infundibulicybe gibba]